jgi:hypothetical protein
VHPSLQELEVRNGIFVNGCGFIKKNGVWASKLVPPFSDDACATFSDGLITHGLHGGLAAAQTLIISSCSERGAADVFDHVSGVGAFANSTTRYSIPDALTSPDSTLFLNLTDNYL